MPAMDDSEGGGGLYDPLGSICCWLDRYTLDLYHAAGSTGVPVDMVPAHLLANWGAPKKQQQQQRQQESRPQRTHQQKQRHVQRRAGQESRNLRVKCPASAASRESSRSPAAFPTRNDELIQIPKLLEFIQLNSRINSRYSLRNC